VAGKNIIKQMKPLLETLGEILAEIDRIEEPKRASEPYPPAAEDEIAAAEKRLGHAFPPSYRAFLQLHNGWHRFRYDWSVVGVSGPGYVDAHKDIIMYVNIYDKSFRRGIPCPPDELKEREPKDSTVIYFPDHYPIATNFNGDYLVIDRNRQRDAGEYEIARVELGYSVVKRYPDFMAYVDDTLKFMRSALKEVGGKPAAVKSAQRRTSKEVKKSGPPKQSPKKGKRS
jgi:cell wall assembly regulator SMI1